MTIMYPPQAAKIERFKTQVFDQTFSQFLYCVQQVFFFRKLSYKYYYGFNCDYTKRICSCVNCHHDTSFIVLLFVFTDMSNIKFKVTKDSVLNKYMQVNLTLPS